MEIWHSNDVSKVYCSCTATITNGGCVDYKLSSLNAPRKFDIYNNREDAHPVSFKV